MTTNSPNPVDGDAKAQPVAWAHRLVNKRNGTIHPWVYGSNEKQPSEGDMFRVEVKPLYDSPPAQLSLNAEQRTEAAEAKAKLCLQNMTDIAHCFSDLRRFIEAKWPTIADLPSCEGILLSGPENKHEVDAMIAALNRVADFYESEPAQLLRPVELPGYVDDLHGIGPVMSADAVVEALRQQGYEVKND